MAFFGIDFKQKLFHSHGTGHEFTFLSRFSQVLIQNSLSPRPVAITRLKRQSDYYLPINIGIIIGLQGYQSYLKCR